MSAPAVAVVGAGLAGSEAAWQVAARGLDVELWEMRPGRMTPAHRSGLFAELVCSNSLGSSGEDKAPGLLQWEMARMGSLVLDCARACAVPAGSALAVDRDAFAMEVTRRVEGHPRIRVRREEAVEVPASRPAVVASGPLTSDALAASIQALTGAGHLYFYDAIAPLVEAATIDLAVAFRASRYGRGVGDDGDYINCPLDREEYAQFVDALLAAERVPPRDFERPADLFFEGCLPVEILAARGRDSLAFGPMRPVGLTDPRTGRRPHAVVQLRQDNIAGTLYNIVGFQTNLRWGDQERVLRMIPGLGRAEFARLGQMHRNTFLDAPSLLEPTMELRAGPGLFFAGQISGVEGYMGNAATGLLAGINAARAAYGQPPVAPPPTTMLGALTHYIARAEHGRFQPMKANFGILPPLDTPVRHKADRYKAYVARARDAMGPFAEQVGALALDAPPG